MSLEIKDDKNRVIVKMQDGKIAVARFNDLSEKYKRYIVELYRTLTNEDVDKLIEFLNFKNKENEFCA